MRTSYLKKYIISSYVLVWVLIIFVAGTASLVFDARLSLCGLSVI